MLTYVLKRILAMVPTLLGITFVTFLIINFAPGDPVAITFGGGGDERTNEGGDDRERQADTIKAKKKLLGMLSEEHAVLAWNAITPPLPDHAPGPDEASVERAHFELQRAGHLVELPAWPHALALSPDGGTVYSAGDDKAPRAVSVSTRSVARVFGAHEVEVWALAVSPDGATLASGDTNGVVKLWSTADGSERASLQSCPSIVRDLAFLPDGSLLVPCDDGRLRLHDAAGAVVASFADHVSGVWTVEAARDGSRFWSGGYDRKIREWNPASPAAPLRVVRELPQAVAALALSPDGLTLAAACDDRGVYLVSLATDAAAPRAIKGHTKGATAVAWSPDGRTLYTGSRDESVRSWDVASLRPLGMNLATTGHVHELLVSKDGATLWSASDSWAPVPLWKRYLKWLARVFTFDFDRSFVDDEKVSAKIAQALPVTLGLNLLALVLIYAVSIPLGVKAAVQRGSAFDHVSSLVLFLLYSIPSFWAATLLIMSFSSKQTFDLLPSVGLESPNARDLSYVSWLLDRLAHLVLPLTVLVYGGFASLSRYARTSMLESIGQDYVRTARAKGLPESAVIFKHALRNSMITIITLVANLLPAMIGGSVIVESIFSIQGMGKLGFDAILSRDYPVIMAITTFSAFLTLLGILVSDLLYSVVDPRISHA